MAIDYTDVEGWFGFTAEDPSDPEYDFPDQDVITAFIASAETDFEADTGLTFDETVAKHLKLMKMYLDRQITGWYKLRVSNADNASNPAGSVSYTRNYVYFNREDFTRLINELKSSGIGPVLSFGNNPSSTGYADR